MHRNFLEDQMKRWIFRVPKDTRLQKRELLIGLGGIRFTSAIKSKASDLVAAITET